MVEDMIPRLLKNDATQFDKLGFGALTNTISCTVTEELGVAPTLEMSVLVDEPQLQNLAIGNIITALPNKRDAIQGFVIEEISKPLDGIVTIYATHIAQHRGKLIPVAPFTALDLDSALASMTSNSMETNPFTLVRDSGKLNVVATMTQTVPHSFRELMGGVEGSIIDTYRGEWGYDNYILTLYNKRGRDNGARVMYGQNMSDFHLDEQFNWDDSATGVIGYWKDENNTVIGDIQYSIYADRYPYKKTICMDFSDKFETQPTKADLNTYAASWIHSKGLFGASVDVAFEHISVDGGADVGLGDTVHIYNGMYNYSLESRIVGTVFDVLREEYTTVTIGQSKTTLNEAISDIGGGSATMVSGGSSVEPSTSMPKMDGIAAIGSEGKYARGDHVHPSDTSRFAKTGDDLTGNVRLISSDIDITESAPVSTPQNAPAFQWTDKNGTTIGTFRLRRLTASDDGAVVMAINVARGGTQNTLSLGVDDNGARVVSANAAGAWRSALGIGTRILGTQTVTLATTASTAVAATATTTGTLTSVSGATNYLLIPLTCSYGIFTALSRSGTTINATLRNISNASHTMASSVLVIAIA